MTTIKRFEDLDVWKKARNLSKDIFARINSGKLISDYPLRDQMRRSSGSIMDNIAEGFERNGTKEFRQFLSIAKGSTRELKSQLYRCLNQNYFNQSAFLALYTKTDEVSKMISGLMIYLKNSIKRGIKY